MDKSWFSKLDIEVQRGAVANTEANRATSSALSSSLNKYETKDKRIKIKCPNSFVRSWIKTNYGSAIEDAIESAAVYEAGQLAEVEYEAA